MRCMGGHCTRDAAHGPGAVDPPVPRLYLTLACPGGGTGRHTVLRGQRRKASRFESGPGHSSKSVLARGLTESGQIRPCHVPSRRGNIPTTRSPMTSMRHVIGLAVMSALFGSALRAQGKFPPDSLTNLKVLPKTSGKQELIATMRSFALGLGVRCTYCHVGREGAPLDSLKFAADDKR